MMNDHQKVRYYTYKKEYYIPEYFEYIEDRAKISIIDRLDLNPATVRLKRRITKKAKELLKTINCERGAFCDSSVDIWYDWLYHIQTASLKKNSIDRTAALLINSILARKILSASEHENDTIDVYWMPKYIEKYIESLELLKNYISQSDYDSVKSEARRLLADENEKLKKASRT